MSWTPKSLSKEQLADELMIKARFKYLESITPEALKPDSASGSEAKDKA